MLIQRGTIVGSYRIEGILGRGGMGVVHSARHVSLDRRVALKVLADELSSSEEFVERFRREGRLQASLERTGCGRWRSLRQLSARRRRGRASSSGDGAR